MTGQAHLHRNHETAIYMLSGGSEMTHGDALGHSLTVRAGEVLSIPAGVPNLPMNTSTDPSTCVPARADLNKKECVVPRPNSGRPGPIIVSPGLRQAMGAK